MKRILKQITLRIMEVHNEERKLLQFLNSLHLQPDQTILDVGCGHGDKLKLIRSLGLNITGVDINPTIIERNQKAGLPCMTADDFGQANSQYDVLLMLHVIEHFHPEQLLKFMDSYLERLKPGGYLIIATPLYTSYFYDDFDHVKPYQPTGIRMVFEETNAQVQYHAHNRLTLQDIWFRREPFRLKFFARFYIRKYSRLPLIINVLLAFVFRFSFGIIGETNGWMGLYQKIAP
jgi:SAM-dependent methyltransferase